MIGINTYKKYCVSWELSAQPQKETFMLCGILSVISVSSGATCVAGLLVPSA
jgi:hypothetical protein